MKPKYRRLTLILLSLSVMAIALYVLLSNLREHLIFFYSPTDIINAAPTSDKTIRVGGLVKNNTIEKEGTLTRFILTDQSNDLNVSYDGLLPDLFRDGQGIVARGHLINPGQFKADQLLAKHDENYMPKEVVESLKKTGHWKEEE